MAAVTFSNLAVAGVSSATAAQTAASGKCDVALNLSTYTPASGGGRMDAVDVIITPAVGAITGDAGSPASFKLLRSGSNNAVIRAIDVPNKFTVAIRNSTTAVISGSFDVQSY